MRGRVPKSIDEYIAGFPAATRARLETVRAAVRKAAPRAEEAIRYGMPTFRLHDRNLVHFAAFKNHIGFYPLPGAIEAFAKDLSRFQRAKGSVQFPMDKPVPVALVRKIVTYRVGENLARERGKG